MLINHLNRQKEQRCMECFLLRERLPGKTICVECYSRWFGLNYIAKPTPTEAEIQAEWREENQAVFVLLEASPLGRSLEQFPEHLRGVVQHLQFHSRIAKVGDLYFLKGHIQRQAA